LLPLNSGTITSQSRISGFDKAERRWLEDEGRCVMTKKVFKEHPKTIIFVSLCVLLLIAFKTWDSYAPLSVHDWNKREISRVKVTDSDNFTFAVFGDNQGNSSFFEPLVRDIEHRQEIAFAIDVGDLVSSGEKKHFRHFTLLFVW